MIGMFGVIPEDIGPGDEGLSHEQRFGARGDGDPRLRALKWRSGRDLLLVDVVHPGTDTSTPLPPRPRRMTDERLWMPIGDDDERVVGPIYRVGVRVSGSLIRARAAEVVRFIPEMTVVVGTQRFCILGSLDGLAPSRLRRLEKMIQGSQGMALKSQVLFPEPVRARRSEPPLGPHPEPATSALPPAAKTILATIEGEALGNSHVVTFQRRGAAGLLNLLEERGLIRILASGQIVSASRYQELCDTLGDLELEFNRRQAAKLWNASVGMADALLDQLARDRMVDKVPGRYYKVKR